MLRYYGVMLYLLEIMAVIVLCVLVYVILCTAKLGQLQTCSNTLFSLYLYSTLAIFTVIFSFPLNLIFRIYTCILFFNYAIIIRPNNGPNVKLMNQACTVSKIYSMAIDKSTSKLFFDRRSFGQSALVSGHYLGSATIFLSHSLNLFSDSCGCFPHYGAPLLWRGQVCFPVRECSS
jgi:hypothetical protein